MHRYSSITWLLLVTVVSTCSSQLGCVRRRLTIRSNPPGSQVYVDNRQLGTTPVSTDFLYYGTRQIRLVKDGYETLTVNQPVPAPWYEIPPLDFVSENLIPREIDDERILEYNLTPQVVVPTEQLLARGEQLRRGTQVENPASFVSRQPVMAFPPSSGSSPPGNVRPLPAPSNAPVSPPGPSTSLPSSHPKTLPPGGYPPVYAPPAAGP